MWGIYHRTRDDTELARICGERDPSKAEVICPWDWELPPNMSNEDLRVFWGTPDFTPGEKDLLRMDLMKYTGKVANKFDILLRKEELSPEQFDQKRKEWSPYWVVDERKTYPPTFFLHGTADSAVPVEQSYRFAEKLKRLDVPTGEAYCPNGEHCFENKIEVSAGRVGSGRVITPAGVRHISVGTLADNRSDRRTRGGTSTSSRVWSLWTSTSGSETTCPRNVQASRIDSDHFAPCMRSRTVCDAFGFSATSRVGAHAPAMRAGAAAAAER